MTTSLTSFSSKYFTSALPDVTIPVSSGVCAVVTVTCDAVEVLRETLWPVGGVVTLSELGELLAPYVQKRLVSSVTISAQQQDAGGSAVGSVQSSTAQVLFSRADVGVSAEDFYGSHFLTVLLGPRTTSLGRLELLWYYGTEQSAVLAEYSDGSTQSFAGTKSTESDTYTCLDVSPGLFVSAGRRLVAYTVTAGERSKEYWVDPRQPDCAPILEFYNSFGVWELIYCTGTHKVSPDFQRSSARIGGLLRNYRVEETRVFDADTGYLSSPMAAWADELFRSDEVYVVNVVDGQVVSRDGGKEVVITGSKSEVSNEDDDLPHFSFTYQYAQRIHNVLQLNRVGRIFDNTFDHTFE